MKWHVLFKTTSFHSLFIKKKTTQNDAVLSGTINLLLSLDVVQVGEEARLGKEEDCSPAASLSLSLP